MGEELEGRGWGWRWAGDGGFDSASVTHAFSLVGVLVMF